MRRTHLITGADGQDGRLLCRLLAGRGDVVVATGLTAAPPLPAGVLWQHLDVTDALAVGDALAEHRPHVVHNVAALSSVGASWQEPELTDRVNHRAVRDLIDVIACQPDPVLLVQASSSEIFGPTGTSPVTERTVLDPRSPYAESKAAAHEAVAQARAAGLAATNLVLFGHTGPLHPDTFVIPSICRQAVEVAQGVRDAVELRDPDVRRDWGAARDFVRAFVLACDAPPDDFVIATGELHDLREVVGWAGMAAGVQLEVRRTAGHRPSDFDGVRGDPRHAGEVLGWHPEVRLADEVAAIVTVMATGSAAL